MMICPDGSHCFLLPAIILLRDQVETLARALDESLHGVLEDYPG